MVLLIGGGGGIGKRYQAVLKSLNFPFRIKEINDPIDFSGIQKAIICTPTETHYKFAELCHEVDIPFLCEKPLSKNVEECQSLVQNCNLGFVVCNYSFIMPAPITSIEYDFFNTGKDGTLWDCCQLVYLAKKNHAFLDIKKQSYKWILKVNGLEIQYREIEESYKYMVKSFLNNEFDKLWSLEDGLKMTEAVIWTEGHLENTIGNSGEIRVEAFP